MTTRDPRSRSTLPPRSDRDKPREPTQPLSVEVELSDDSEPSQPSLAIGTSDAARDDPTKVASPSGRNRPAQPRSPRVPVRDPDDPEARLGSVLGAYKLLELLGRGGMGYVYRAEHVRLGREVALKLLRADYAKRRDPVLRFFQEAKTVNRVRHRNIVDVTDFIELEDGTTFIIMELLHGHSLGNWARTGVDLARALAVLVQICDGLGAAHAVGVVHRDLKPDNVIIVPTSDGAELVKLLDFGVAKLVNRDDEDVGFQTAAGSVIGTPAYMSPEQAGGMALDHRSDIYSLGALMYELFCGEPMFRGRSFGEYVRKHLIEIPVPPSQTEHGATIDHELEALILKAVAKEPDDRFSHILELRDALLHLLGGMDTLTPSHGSRANTALPAPVVTTVLTPPPVSTGVSRQHSSPGYTQRAAAPARSGTPVWVWLIAGAFAIAIGVGGALWYADHSAATPTPQPARATQPTSAPIEPASVRASLVELRFDSLPSGGVYADGRSAELCHTPCNVNVDLGDGGPTNRRTFVVRSAGYQDMPIDVDFTKPQRDYAVTLVQLAPPILDMAGTDARTGAKPPGKSIDHARPSTDDRKPSTESAKPAAGTTPPAADDTRLERVETDKNPDDKKPDDKKRAVPIDPADTIDPFRKK